jgi:hypothetical protein
LDKIILVLDGVSSGKTLFIDTIKQDGFWVWNVNPFNVLSMLSHKMGWDGQRTKEYYEYVNKLKDLVDQYLGFEKWNTEMMVAKFFRDDKAEVFIAHNFKDETKQFLKEKYENYHSILVTDSDLKDDTYDVTYNYKADDYTDKLLDQVAEWLNKNVVVEEVKEQDAEK